MINYFSFYRPVFMLQLLIAEFLFTVRLRKRRLFWLRFCAGAAICLLFATFVPLSPNSFIELGLTFVVMFAVTLTVNIFIFDVPLSNLLLCLSAAYTVQHFAYCISNCAMLLTKLNANVYGVYTEEVIVTGALPLNHAFGYIISFTLYYLTYYLFYIFVGHRIRKNETFRHKSKPLFVLSILAILFSVFVNAFVVYRTVDGNLIIAINFYNALCCVFIVCTLFGMSNSIKTQNELSKMHDILRKAEDQYKINRDVIEKLNIKCHDMKQQIHTLGKSNTISKAASSEILSAIAAYDSQIDTGNKPLDVILTEKSAECAEKGIVLSCIADGSLLGFMKEVEIYSMFGNALDNAIAAVSTLDADKRYIGLKVTAVQGFVTIGIHNCYEGNVVLNADSLPRTTKTDDGEHGYGLKSIKYTVEKNGGNMSVETSDGLFCLNIIFKNEMRGGGVEHNLCRKTSIYAQHLYY